MSNDINKIGFKPDWEAVFRRDFCKVCENYRICPYSYQCHDMKIFIKENEEAHEQNLHDDDSQNSA